VSEVIGGVRQLVAAKIIGSAMEIVAAGPSLNGDDCAGGKAVVGIVTVGDYAELLCSVGIREGRGQRHIGVHVGRAVEHIVGAALTSASGRSACGVGEGRFTLRLAAGGTQNVDHARAEKHQT